MTAIARPSGVRPFDANSRTVSAATCARNASISGDGWSFETGAAALSEAETRTEAARPRNAERRVRVELRRRPETRVAEGRAAKAAGSGGRV